MHLKLGVSRELNEFVTLDDVVLGHKLIDVAGSGGMGKVFRAIDPAERMVALKIAAGQERADTMELYNRCKREVAAMCRLNGRHSSLPVIHQWGLHKIGLIGASFPVISMEFYDGRDLTGYDFKTPQHIGNVMWQVLGGLEMAHGENIIHRDIKPGNILLTWDGKAKLLDYGLARGHCMDDLTACSGDPVVGTPSFMSPEQINQDNVTHLTDIYSLGVTLYSLLTGTALPFPGSTAYEVISNVLKSYLPPLSKNIPPKFRPFEDEILKFEIPLRAMTCHDPEHRAQSATEVRNFFEEYAFWNPAMHYPKLNLTELVALAEDSKMPDKAFAQFAKQRCGKALFLSLSFLRRLANIEDYEEGLYLDDKVRIPYGKKDSVTIGRSPDCDYILRMEGSANHVASKVHAELLEEDGNFFLRDLNSTNGTGICKESSGFKSGFGYFHEVTNDLNGGRGVMLEPGYWVKFGHDSQHEMHQFTPIEYLRSVLRGRNFYSSDSNDHTKVCKRPDFNKEAKI